MDFKAKGINTPQELLKFMEENLKYGFTYKEQIFTEDDPNFQEKMDQLYVLKTEEDLIESGYGVCWDACEFERRFCEQNNIKHECFLYLSFLSREEGGPTHTFLLFEQDKKWFWFEYTWSFYKGIWRYNSKDEALQDILKKFCAFNVRTFDRVEIYKTFKANSGLNTYEFIEHCMQGEKVDLKQKDDDREKG